MSVIFRVMTYEGTPCRILVVVRPPRKHQTNSFRIYLHEEKRKLRPVNPFKPIAMAGGLIR